MRKSKRKRLQAKGWKVGTARQFLQLSDEEDAYIEFAAEAGAGSYSGLQMRATNKRRGRPVCLPRCRGRTARAGADTQVCPYLASQFVVNGTHATANRCKERRIGQGLTQVQLAKAVRSSQSRVAKMEAGDTTVSLDLLVRSLLALGTTNRELAQIIARRPVAT